MKWALRRTSRGGRVQVVCLTQAVEQPSHIGRHRNKRTRPKALGEEEGSVTACIMIALGFGLPH